MTLANREVSAAAGNCSIESDPSFIIFVLDGEQASSTESIVECGVVVLIERIQISPEGIRQQLGDLRDDGDIRSEGLQVDLLRVHAVKVDGALREDTPKQCQGQRALSTTGATDDANMFSGCDSEIEVMEDLWTIRTVLGRQALHDHFPAGWPVSRRNIVRHGFLLLFDVNIALDTFQTDGRVRNTFTSSPGDTHLFPLTSNSFRIRTHHKIMLLKPTAMFKEKPIAAA